MWATNFFKSLKKKSFVVHERSGVKNPFITYVWSKVDSCFCGAVYISRIQDSARSVLQTGLYKVVTAWKKDHLIIICFFFYSRMLELPRMSTLSSTFPVPLKAILVKYLQTPRMIPYQVLSSPMLSRLSPKFSMTLLRLILSTEWVQVSNSTIIKCLATNNVPGGFFLDF